ncbi:unnamed protein product [Phyllotreta striolata]|uniref:Malate dehydrogenase 1B n=1 Tax=Phyllotreta striolata TaxID=444603 RepID=A0A9N9TWY7_PHYSR|nr:unnamed protein product [Phyllotreta striolata]
MPYFSICGVPNCPNFAHAVFVANYLSEKLPNFFYKKIEKIPREWAVFLDELNRENKWYTHESPVIWKELYQWGGTKYLIGGLSEFWEHVYCYYGLESLIPKYALDELALDNLRFFADKRRSEARKVKNVAILGAGQLNSAILIQDLLEIKTLRKGGVHLVFKLYDHHQNIDRSVFQHLNDTALHFNSTSFFGDFNLVELYSSAEDAMADSDIILNLDDYNPKDADFGKHMNRCTIRMKMLADHLLVAAKRDAKIIFAGSGPLCYMATALSKACSEMFPNIVVITADKGFPFVTAASEETGIEIHRISAPVVWGSIGVNCFVDIRNAFFKADVYRPYRCSLTAPKGSTLPLGVVSSELRLMGYKIKDAGVIERKVKNNTKKMEDLIGRASLFSKLRAIGLLLKLWYADEVGDEIISLGVRSNGSFHVPKGMFFSQPVKLSESRVWVPYSNYPLKEKQTKKRIKQCILHAKDVFGNLGIMYDPDDGFDEDWDDYSKYLGEIGEGEEEEMYE